MHTNRRPPEMCGLRTRPRTDVDPPRFLPPSNNHRRGRGISSRRPPPSGAIPRSSVVVFVDLSAAEQGRPEAYDSAGRRRRGRSSVEDDHPAAFRHVVPSVGDGGHRRWVWSRPLRRRKNPTCCPSVTSQSLHLIYLLDSLRAWFRVYVPYGRPQRSTDLDRTWRVASL